MPILTKSQLEELNQASFPDQSTEAITPQILREYNTATIDTLVDSLDTGSFIQDLTSLNSFTQSQLEKDSTLGSYTGSVNTQLGNLTQSQSIDNQKWNTLGTQSGSWVSSSITGSSLITASFDNGTRNLTFTKGDTTQFSLNIPDASGSILPAGVVSGSSQIDYPQISNIPSGIVSQSVQVSAITGSSVITASFDNGARNLTFTKGNNTQFSVNIPGGSIDTGSFATTGSNTFTGTQIITGDGLTIDNQFGYINIRGNENGSGSQFPGAYITVAPNVYPGDIFGGYTIFREEDLVDGKTFLGMVANSYSPQYGPTTVPMIIANGNNPAGSDTAIIFAPNGTAEHYKKSDFKYGVDITGSLKTSGSNIFIGNQTITGSLNVSSSVPMTFNIPAPGYLQNGITFNGNVGVSGDFKCDAGFRATAVYANTLGSFNSNRLNITAEYVNYETGLPDNRLSNVLITGSLSVSGSFNTNGNSTFTGSITQNGNTIINSSGGNGLTINNGGLESQGTIFSDTGINVFNQYGNIGVSANAQGSGSQYPGFSVAVDTVAYTTDIYGGYSINDGNNQTLAAFVANSYTPEYGGTPTIVLLGGGNNSNGSNTAIALPSNGQLDLWKKTNHKYEATFTTGSNQQAGTATLNGANPGTVTVSNSLVSANSIILLTKQTYNHPQGIVAISAKSAGSFTITSNHNGDTDVVGWFIINNS